MGAFGMIVGTLHYMGLYIQLSATSRPNGHTEVENHLTGNAMFTEVPQDLSVQRGQDVEMACSFRGAGTPSYSLEIQWWYIRNQKDWSDKQPWETNQVVPQDYKPKDATKISVVKVAGSNISHKLRLSSVKPSDEGTYECRVIDLSDTTARHHRARAYLQVLPERHQDQEVGYHGASLNPQQDSTKSAISSGGHHPHHHTHLQEQGLPAAAAAQHSSIQAGKEARKRSGESHSPSDCIDSCVP
ncbi:V-set and transmembrane domain-containing protein 2-like protein [Osmerus eperlanus]|uniref:V-set and transmembrane domain-containing protein 2-like protein n=1 Tax=Osmerus eperlanus TaxID=29151 RepID=UPI002E12F3FB